MPIVRIETWPLEKKELKKKIAKEVTDIMMNNIGCPAQAVTVLFDERPQENWASAGELHCDLFKK
ncbi:4-oxalocrotonate tautomerase family protein [Elusimicrobiota bacterium]